MTADVVGSQAGTSGRFPEGFRVALRDDVRRRDGGRLLVGGSPLRVVRLSDRARTLLTPQLRVHDPATEGLAARLLDGNLADPVLDDITMDLAELTVVVPVRDRAEQLDRCLAALAPCHVVVVDDASYDPDRVKEVCERYGATRIALTHNRGPAGARNAGLRTVTTPYVAFVDSDVEVTPDALLRLARHLADRQVALVGPLIRGIVRSPRPRWFERYDAAASSLDLGRRPCSVRPGAIVGWLPSACLVGRTAALTDGFDEDMRVGEDVEFIWRLTDQGKVVRYDPTVTVLHDVRATIRDWLGRKFFYGTGSADLARRHGDRGAPAVMSPVAAVAAAALLLRRPWPTVLAIACTAHAAHRLRRTIPASDARDRLSLELAAEGTWWAVRQQSALLLRHWWPLTFLGLAGRVPLLRRAVITALAVDTVTFLRERPDAGLVAALLGRRLDDLAYGAGLWAGALRLRNSTCLLVRWTVATKR